MITYVGLVQRVLDVTTGRSEVGEVHHGNEIEDVVEMTGIISPRQVQ